MYYISHVLFITYIVGFPREIMKEGKLSKICTSLVEWIDMLVIQKQITNYALS